MNEYICTFGLDQKLKNNFVRVHASTEEEAREKMFATYGALWAFLYLDETQAGIKRHGLIEVPFGTPNERMK